LKIENCKELNNFNKEKEVVKLKKFFDIYFDLKEQKFPIKSSKEFLQNLMKSLKADDVLTSNEIILTETINM
jgi:hypothetical protein